MCKSKFRPHEHKLGLVFNDTVFLCEDCQKQTPDEEIQAWTKSVMHDEACGMPISLWLIHEQNKGKEPFSGRRDD
jgi:hypothetical protein